PSVRKWRPRPPPAGRTPERTSCEPSRALLVDLVRVRRPPRKADPLALLRERLLRGRLEVLANDDEVAARIEVDDVARDHADVDDLAHRAGLPFSGVVVDHPDLLRPDREAPAVSLEHVRDADETGDQPGLRALVHLR